MNELLTFLTTTQPGGIPATGELERFLATAWEEFQGDDEGMEGYKLLGRMERVEWHPPVLSFTIERHGRTCSGSTRADLQRWSLDVNTRTATCNAAGHRQVWSMAPRVSVKGLAEELADRIVRGEKDDRLSRWEDGSVSVRASSIFPTKSGFKQTVESRRKRLH